MVHENRGQSGCYGRSRRCCTQQRQPSIGSERYDLGQGRGVREQRQLEDQHREWVLRGPSIQPVDLARLPRVSVRFPGRPGDEEPADHRGGASPQRTGSGGVAGVRGESRAEPRGSLTPPPVGPEPSQSSSASPSPVPVPSVSSSPVRPVPSESGSVPVGRERSREVRLLRAYLRCVARGGSFHPKDSSWTAPGSSPGVPVVNPSGGPGDLQLRLLRGPRCDLRG